MKTCRIEGCVNVCEKSRTYCREHYLQRKREQAKLRYLEKGKTKYKRYCEICDKLFEGDRKNSRFCSLECYYKYTRVNSSSSTNKYSYVCCKDYPLQHRKIAEDLIGRKLEYNEVVHHLDGNPKNNDVSNLLLMQRRDHVRLHAVLTRHRASLLKDKDENSENCWDNLRGQITTTWLETEGVKVIKISDIGQSAAETPTDISEE